MKKFVAFSLLALLAFLPVTGYAGIVESQYKPLTFNSPTTIGDVLSTFCDEGNTAFNKNNSTTYRLHDCNGTPAATQVWPLATVATSGDYTDLINKPAAFNPTPAIASRTLNSCFQISSTKTVLASYSVDVAATLSLVTGQVGTAFLEYSDDSGCSSNTTEVARFVNGNSGTLAIGLNLTQSVTSSLTGFIPAGKYVKIRTANTTGTPTFTYRSGQETTF